MSRLISVNSIDDWCTFASPDGESIADVEGEVVAYCTKARNNARVIPDGTLTAVHFITTPLYVQVMALGDFTKIGLQEGDDGGELDPHGATGAGNPVGGNVTSNITGSDVFYEEWMNYVAYNELCIRICIAGTDTAPTALECQHTLDEMGCEWVMPGSYTDNVFESCEADAAWPPGLFSVDGSTSTFQQYYSSVYTDPNGGKHTFVNGSPDQSTPTAAYSKPSSSSCTTISTISNGIASLVSSSSSSSSSAASSMSTSTRSSASASSGSDAAASATASAASAASSSTSGASGLTVGALAASVAGLIAAAAML